LSIGFVMLLSRCSLRFPFIVRLYFMCSCVFICPVRVHPFRLTCFHLHVHLFAKSCLETDYGSKALPKRVVLWPHSAVAVATEPAFVTANRFWTQTGFHNLHKE
jgi:hypothetical protein